MALGFGGKEARDPFALVPAGTLAFAHVSLKETKNSQNTGGRMFNLEVTVTDGPFERRKLFALIADPADKRNNETFRQMGQTAMQRLLDYLPQVNKDELQAEGDAAEGQLVDYVISLIDNNGMGLHGVGIKIAIEKGKDGNEDRNKVGEWLSPNPDSGGYKLWQKLRAGDVGVAPAPAVRPATTAAFGQRPPAQPAPGGFGQSHAPNAPAATATRAGFGSPPEWQKQAAPLKDTDIPF